MVDEMLPKEIAELIPPEELEIRLAGQRYRAVKSKAGKLGRRALWRRIYFDGVATGLSLAEERLREVLYGEA